MNKRNNDISNKVKTSPLFKFFYNISIIRKNYYLFESNDDFSEGTIYLFNHFLKKGKKCFWIIKKSNIKYTSSYGVKNYILYDRTSICERIKYAYILGKCKYIIFSHRNPVAMYKKRKQICLYLTHGQPFKYTPAYSNYSYQNAISITNNEFTKRTVLKAFKINDKDLYCCLNPRILPLINSGYQKDRKIIGEFLNISQDSKFIIYMPSFNNYKTVGELDNLFPFNLNLDKLNDLLKKYNYFFVIKPHPMTKASELIGKYSNLKIINNNELISNNLLIYDILPHSSCLVTDYSSIFIDYYLTLKPIIFLKTDSKKKDFIFENYADYMVGPIVDCEDDFCEFLQKIMQNKFPDYYDLEKERKRWNEPISDPIALIDQILSQK